MTLLYGRNDNKPCMFGVYSPSIIDINTYDYDNSYVIL